ncbi:MAG TPA: SLATT domain-containing protein [Arenimonas sp.]|nr:SLATT domain-containing protein [Arenimonas sp.]
MSSVNILEDQIRECFGRVVYTHKTHETMADICAERLSLLKIVQIVVSAFAAFGALAIVFADPFWLKLGTAVLSFVTLWVSGYMKGFDPGGTAQKHRDAAATLWDIRESYLSLLTDLKRGSASDPEATGRRDELQRLLAKIYKGAPQTNNKAYVAAQKALKESEDYTFSAEEIDAFLPATLKRTAK